MGLRTLGFTDLQISRREVVVRHIGKDATGLYGHHGTLVVAEPNRLFLRGDQDATPDQ
jgi:hypothetical protein